MVELAQTLPAEVTTRPPPTRLRLVRRPTSIPDDLLRMVEETVTASSIGLVFGQDIVAGARITLNRHVIQIDRESCQFIIEGTEDRRILRGYTPRWLVEMECRLMFTADGWCEVAHEIREYKTVEDLSLRRSPYRCHRTETLEDGSVLTTSLTHHGSEATREEELRRSTCMTQVDGSRIEEVEELSRVDKRERYRLTRTEFDDDYRRRKNLEYDYPELSTDFYKPIRAKLERWETDPAWVFVD